MESDTRSSPPEHRTSVFFLAADPAESGCDALAAALARDGVCVAVGLLGHAGGPAAAGLRAAGVAVCAVPVRHALDLSGARRLRRAVAECSPAVVHAFGPAAARASRLVVAGGEGGNTPRLVVSGAAVPGSGVSGWLAARQTRRADRVIPATRAEGERYRRLGVPADNLTRIPPAAPDHLPAADPAATLAALSLPPGSRLVVAGGRAARGVGPKDAIVAFDMLRYDAPDLHLAVYGAGTAATALEQFGRALAFDDFRVHFPAGHPDRAAAVAAAAAVWVTAPVGGADEALEAMAAGRPVVGWNTTDLAEVVADGETGFLVPVGDRAALAAKARALLEDPDRAAAMGEAGRRRAAERFAFSKTVEQFARVYAELGAWPA